MSFRDLRPESIMRRSAALALLPGLLLATTLVATACDQGGPAESAESSPPSTPVADGPATPASTSPPNDSPAIRPQGSVAVRAGATAVYAEAPDLDFGMVRPGTRIRGEFLLVNPTDQPVKVLKAVPTCQCTTVEVSGLAIPPGGGLTIPATLQVPNTTGLKQAAINMMLEGPTGPVGGPRLTLSALAAYPVRTQPLYVDALKPEGMTGNVTLESTDGRPFRVLSVNGRPPVLKTPDQPLTQHLVAYDLTDETQASMPKWLLFETDHPEAAMIEMRVRHNWSRLPHQFPNYKVRIQFDGYIANLGAVVAGTPAVFNLELKNFAGQQVLRLRSGDPDFKIDLLEQTPGDGGRVRVTAALTPTAAVSGSFMVPITFDATTGSETMYAIGVVRP